MIRMRAPVREVESVSGGHLGASQSSQSERLLLGLDLSPCGQTAAASPGLGAWELVDLGWPVGARAFTSRREEEDKFNCCERARPRSVRNTDAISVAQLLNNLLLRSAAPNAQANSLLLVHLFGRQPVHQLARSLARSLDGHHQAHPGRATRDRERTMAARARCCINTPGFHPDRLRALSRGLIIGRLAFIARAILP